MQQVNSWEPLSLRRNFSWTLAGNVVYALSQWGILVALAQFSTPETVGQFALGLAVTAPVMMFANLQLRGVQATDAQRTHPFHHYLILRLVTMFLALLVILGIVYFAGYRGNAALIILVVGLAKAFESVSDVFYGLLQQRERMDRISHSLMLRGLLSLVAFTTALYLTRSLVWAVLAMAASWAAVLFFHDVRNGVHLLRQDAATAPNYAPFRLSALPKPLGRLTLTALPLGFVMMFGSLNTNIPRYFIEGHLGTRELGIFAALAYLIVAGNTVIGALGQSASPRLAQHYAAGDTSSFRKLLAKLMLMGAILGAAGFGVAVVAGGPLLELIYGPEYAAHTVLFVWLMVAAGFAYVSSFMGYGLTAARKLNVQFPISVLSLLLTLMVSPVLIPRYGLSGAALAVLSSFLAQILLKGMVLRSLAPMAAPGNTEETGSSFSLSSEGTERN